MSLTHRYAVFCNGSDSTGTLSRVKFDVIHFDTLGLAQYKTLVSGVGTVLNHHARISLLKDVTGCAKTTRGR